MVPSRVFASAGRRLDDLTHRDKRTIEAIRRQLAAGNVDFRTALADTTQQIELRLLPELEHRAELQAGTESALEKVQDTLAACAADLERAMQGVSDLCATVVEQLEADRLERPVLTEAIEYLSELYSDDTEISIIEDDEPVRSEPVRSEPVPFTYEPYAAWGHRDDNGGGMLTSVKRLRQRAQRAGARGVDPSGQTAAEPDRASLLYVTTRENAEYGEHRAHSDLGQGCARTSGMPSRSEMLRR